MKYEEILKIARKLRNEQTPAEQALWQELRKKKLNGKKFLRQHPIIYEFNRNELFFFIPDFYCAERKLAIELDGKIHDFSKERDNNRDMILKAKGISVLRILNKEIRNMEVVKEKICGYLTDTPCSPPTRRGTAPKEQGVRKKSI